MTITVPDPTREDEVPTFTLASIIRELDDEHPEYSDRELTTLVVERLAECDDPLDVVHPALVAYACTVRRNRVRVVEKRATVAWNPIDPLKGRKEAMADFRKWAAELADSTITLNKVKVRAGAMTTADWQQRISELRVGIARDAESCERIELIVERLTRARCSTLDAYLAR